MKIKRSFIQTKSFDIFNPRPIFIYAGYLWIFRFEETLAEDLIAKYSTPFPYILTPHSIFKQKLHKKQIDKNIARKLFKMENIFTKNESTVISVYCEDKNFHKIADVSRSFKKIFGYNSEETID